MEVGWYLFTRLTMAERIGWSIARIKATLSFRRLRDYQSAEHERLQRNGVLSQVQFSEWPEIDTGSTLETGVLQDGREIVVYNCGDLSETRIGGKVARYRISARR